MSNPICQCCGEEIKAGEEAVTVSYGFIAKSGRFYNRRGGDVFHAKCDKAFRKIDQTNKEVMK